MKKAIFIFRCPVKMNTINLFFQRRNITLDAYTLNRRINEFREHFCILFLRNIKPHLIKNAQVELGSNDYLVFYSVPLAYSIADAKYIVMGKVPYMATPVICEIDMNSEYYQLELSETTSL